MFTPEDCVQVDNIDRIPTRRITMVCPVWGTRNRIQFQVYGFREVIVYNINICL
jgi:hypothetical protein